MKHIKLFENFDPYDFGTLVGQEADSEFNNAYEASLPFEEEDRLRVYHEFQNYEIKEYPKNTTTSTIVISNNSNRNVSISLYYHGDYCYSVSEIDEIKYEAISLHRVDALDEAISKMKEILSKWENI